MLMASEEASAALFRPRLPAADPPSFSVAAAAVAAVADLGGRPRRLGGVAPGVVLGTVF